MQKEDWKNVEPDTKLYAKSKRLVWKSITWLAIEGFHEDWDQETCSTWTIWLEKDFFPSLPSSWTIENTLILKIGMNRWEWTKFWHLFEYLIIIEPFFEQI
jgi:hypothetical protein